MHVLPSVTPLILKTPLLMLKACYQAVNSIMTRPHQAVMWTSSWNVLYLGYGFIHSHNLVTHCHFPMFQQNGTSISTQWPQRMRLEKGIGKPIYPN